MIGGLLEYGALVIGYRSLLLVVAALYCLAFWSRPKESAGGASPYSPAANFT
jgi:hypothetical protein